MPLPARCCSPLGATLTQVNNLNLSLNLSTSNPSRRLPSNLSRHRRNTNSRHSHNTSSPLSHNINSRHNRSISPNRHRLNINNRSTSSPLSSNISNLGINHLGISNPSNSPNLKRRRAVPVASSPR